MKFKKFWRLPIGCRRTIPMSESSAMAKVECSRSTAPRLTHPSNPPAYPAISATAPHSGSNPSPELLTDAAPVFSPRLAREMHQIEQDTQALLEKSASVRANFMKNLNFKNPEHYAKTSAEYQKVFYERVIGKFDPPLLNPKP